VLFLSSKLCTSLHLGVIHQKGHSMAVNPTIVKIEKQFFTPGLQQAMSQAQENGHSFNDAIMGATNAHLNMLVELIGAAETKALLQSQVSFLEAQS
jgi:hypothetical protein